jgi:hypothetical protein
MSLLKNTLAAAALFVTGLVSTNAFAEPLEVNVRGNAVEANIALPGGITADLTLRFENAIGLTKDSIGISAELVDVTALSFVNRLPNSLSVTPSAAFPMMITIEPLANSGFSFSGLATVDIHTHNLEYTANTPLRFFKAPLNGQFKDITMTTGAGSYRARGSTGKFSQFIIVADLRAPTTVIAEKFADLSNAASQFSSSMSATASAEVAQRIGELEQLINAGDYVQAASKLNSFNRYVNDNRGLHIPDVWRSSRDISNVAGELMAYANTLRYSLRLID